MIAKLRAFAAFCYDFVVGDDWRVAVGVVAALGLTYGLSRTGIPVWWVLPVALLVLLPLSLWRMTRPKRT
jgi:hypothetical protein